MSREPVEKPARAAGNPSRSQPGLPGTGREGALGYFLSVLTGILSQVNFKITRTKLILFALTLIAVGFALGGLERAEEDVDISHKVVDLALPERQDILLPAPDGLIPGSGEETTTPEIEQWESVAVRSGQSLDGIFRGQNFSANTLHGIMNINKETKRLKNIRPGDLFEFQRYEDGSLKRMRYAIDEDRYLIIDHDRQEAMASFETRDMITEITETGGTITSSLFLAGKKAGLSDGMVMKLANLFGWDIDFVLDIREGDRFFLLYEKVYRDGAFLRDGEIIGATFINQGQKFQALRFDIDGQAQYFAPDGRNMRKAFLRAPLNFAYISSNFNPKRYHPILKRVKAHNGIDYKAPRGTPVYAAGDGKVIRSGYSKYNGHHVFIQHANSIVTKYLHFTKRTVKKGQRVKQGKVIGYVGATGLAQAPHLHYEFLLNGVHRNPRTVSLPKADPLGKKQLLDFQQKAAPVLTQLSRLESASMYATATGDK
ncbi:MAG: peptidoglycan DD-metalloendopeptidase family protein [Xanthomonadales bacterium]|nr:peptidoglycan DD-metalloendopeptidase family protein [Xanthomonadales bacterium]